MYRLFLALLCLALTPTLSSAFEPLAEIETSVKDALDKLKLQAGRLDSSGERTAVYHNLDHIKQAVDDFNKVIYRYDDRKNFYEVGASAQTAANATVILVDALAMSSGGNGSQLLPSKKSGLCTPEQLKEIRGPSGESYQSEPFSDEPAPGNCSGVKVGRNVIATAAHCVRSEAHCKTIRFVTGFYRTSEASVPDLKVPGARIYSCRKLIDRDFDEHGPDWALVEVDRELVDMPTATLADKQSLKLHDGVTVVGYPMGLPVKIAAGANVRRLEKSYFVANLDTYGGNSGSAVFDTDALLRNELLVVGLLVRGEDDFVVESPCRVSTRCPAHGCRGEDVVYADEFRSRIPRN